MLNKENIHHLLLNPNSIQDEETTQIESLLKEFPYAHSLNLLYLKGLKNTKNLNYEKQLPKTSIRVPNREILYQLIIQEDLVKTIKKEIQEDKIEIPEIIIETKIELSAEETNSKKEEPHIGELEQTILSEVTSYNIEKEALSILKTQEETPKKQPSSQSFISWLNTGNESKKEHLIDDFIANNPSITPNKSEIYAAPNVAKMTLIEDEGFVTETLARVYMKQGHFDKAIKTYQKLSLKIPEKKAFFASQIEVIEELIKQE